MISVFIELLDQFLEYAGIGNAVSARFIAIVPLCRAVIFVRVWMYKLILISMLVFFNKSREINMPMGNLQCIFECGRMSVSDGFCYAFLLLSDCRNMYMWIIYEYI